MDLETRLKMKEKLMNIAGRLLVMIADRIQTFGWHLLSNSDNVLTDKQRLDLLVESMQKSEQRRGFADRQTRIRISELRSGLRESLKLINELKKGHPSWDRQTVSDSFEADAYDEQFDRLERILGDHV